MLCDVIKNYIFKNVPSTELCRLCTESAVLNNHVFYHGELYRLHSDTDYKTCASQLQEYSIKFID